MWSTFASDSLMVHMNIWLILLTLLAVILYIVLHDRMSPPEYKPVADNGVFIKITPFPYSNNNNDTSKKQAPHLDITMILDSAALTTFPYALAIPVEENGIKLPTFDKNPIFAYDDKGNLPLHTHINTHASPPRREWFFLQRHPHGNIRFQLRVAAHDTNHTDPRTFPHLRYDAKGAFTGALNTFIPQPPSHQPFTWTLTFDLRNMPPNALAAWTWGEYHPALSPVLTTRGTPAAALNTVLAIGALHKYPPGVNAAESFGAYSTQHTPPANITQWTAELAAKTASFFHEPHRAYRLFFVRNPYRGGAGMCAFAQSLVLAYTDGMSGPDPGVTRDLVARRLVQSWLRLVETAADVRGSARWFNGGVGLYYGALLPCGFGMMSWSGVLVLLNRFAAAYYTSEAIAWTNDELTAAPASRETIHMQAEFRGFMYFVGLAYELRNTPNAPDLDSLMVQIVANERAGLHDHVQTWKNTVALYLGQKGWDGFEAMMDGAFMMPHPDSFAYLGMRCVRQDLYGFELGFAEECLDGSEEERVVYGLVVGSRAEKAGVRNGDVVVEHKSSTFRPLVEDYEARMVLRVRQGEKEVEIEYWPRSWEEVEAYQWILADAEKEMRKGPGQIVVGDA
ncbi:hypothetical protein EJ05DRAFT_476678 [Pseudovirgaria hyperparasitica]|uniref:PDZ domain-containing protein n=1 Tax=Pseudovirgaria hyperparasitica TaxID=470096 RepID=A0A6A6W770_9PEZI|nr:uncharacterized protein EJ05DRAFT_476678 [Pseudovirgaria hyperparasitica]KAF2757417.1 hypothetical protein EJ05DRAFT_476678 [Pseudovirgaria hyperparasitica]